jgi:hypothetical protein
MIPGRLEGATDEGGSALKNATSRVGRTIGFLLGLVALAAVPVIGFGEFAGADSGASSADDGAAAGAVRGRPVLTDEQQQCLADHGITPPTRPADGSLRQPPTAADRGGFRAAAEACGLPLPERRGGPGGPGGRPVLTDEQRQCLADHGITLPERPEVGSERQRPSDAERDTFRAAAEACGITQFLPHGSLRTA